MGILVVLIFYAIFLTVLATISGAVLFAITKWYLRNSPQNSARPLLLAALFPLCCVVFAGVWFVGYAVVNEFVFHHDPMLGDGWYTPIGNGYAIDMIDVTDHGIVHPLGDLNGSGSLDGVRRLQIIGDQIYGTQDTKIFQNFGSGVQGEDMFFSLDTRSRKKREFLSEAVLKSDAAQRGVRLNLEPIAQVYDKFRIGWFDWVAGLFLLLLPSLAFVRFVFYLRTSKGLG